MCVFLYRGDMCMFVNVCLVMSVLQNEYTKKGAMPFSACPFLKVCVMIIRRQADRMFPLSLRADCLPILWSAPEPCCCSVRPV